MPRAKKICAKPGCPAIADGGSYCPTHRREADKARGTRTQRGYDAAHFKLRGQWADKVADGSAVCARCHQPIYAGQGWALDHDDHDRTKYLGVSHTQCNNSAGGKQRHAKRP